MIIHPFKIEKEYLYRGECKRDYYLVSDSEGKKFIAFWRPSDFRCATFTFLPEIGKIVTTPIFYCEKIKNRLVFDEDGLYCKCSLPSGIEGFSFWEHLEVIANRYIIITSEGKQKFISKTYCDWVDKFIFKIGSKIYKFKMERGEQSLAICIG